MSGILGGVLGTRAPTDDLPPGAPRGKEAERLLAAELLQELRAIRAHMTDTNERRVGGVVNHVLEVRTATFPTSGYLTYSWSVPAGCIEVNNMGTGTVTVESGGPSSYVPAAGQGVYPVPAGTIQPVSLASQRVTLWGTSGETVAFHAFTIGRQTPRSGLGAVDGGAP